MEHKEILEMIKTGIYDELDILQNEEFLKHLSECSECREEYEKQEELKNTLKKSSISEVDEKLLQEARMELHGALRSESFKESRFKNFNEKLSDFFASGYRLALSGAAVLLIGFLAGFLIFNNNSTSGNLEGLVQQNKTNAVLASNPIIPDNNAWISNVRFINKNPKTGEVEFTFEATKLVHVNGNVNDHKIQSLLLYAMLNEPNPGVRLNTLNAIDKDQTQSTNDELENAIIKVAETDKNPGVRRAALRSLTNFQFDENIKNALLFVLENDDNSSLRIDAINSLVNAKNKGFNFNTKDMNILKNRIEKDQNSYVRVAAQTVLEGSK